jgi:hypothetical protein
MHKTFQVMLDRGSLIDYNGVHETTTLFNGH